MLKIDNDLIKKYEKLVYSIVNKYSNGENKEDLFQAGMIGILNASEKYDSSLNTQFTSFAYKYILGEILKTLREDRNIRISREYLSDYKKIIVAKEHIYKTYGRTVNNNELSKIIDIPEERINEALYYNEKEISLNMVISDDEKLCLEDVIYNKEEIDEANMIDLYNAFDTLSIEEKELIYKRYFQNKTQSEIAKENNSTQVKVYRYERKILDKLKDKML